MFISPKTAISEGWIKFPDWMDEEQQTKCIQPNAIDITADGISQIIAGAEGALLSESDKRFHNLLKCDPDADGYVDLLPNGLYDVHSDFYVDLPEGVAAELVIRSTLNRMGVVLNSGLWDSGYRGHLGAVIRNRSGLLKLHMNTRVCQIKFIRSEVSGVVYAGGYNKEKGEHWAA